MTPMHTKVWELLRYVNKNESKGIEAQLILYILCYASRLSLLYWLLFVCDKYERSQSQEGG